MRIITAAVLLFSIAYAEDCGPGWQLRAGSNFCYRYEQTEKAWDDARSACVSYGGNLLTISDDAEKDYVDSLLQAEERPVWIGLVDELAEGVWRWADLSCVGFTNWSPIDWIFTEPSYNEGGRECVTILPANRKWNDDGCAKAYPFVCRKKLVGQGQVTLNTACETGCTAEYQDSYVGYIYENNVCTCQHRVFQYSVSVDTVYVVCSVHVFPTTVDITTLEPTTTPPQTEAPTTTATPDATTTQSVPGTTRRHHKCKKHG